LRSSRLFWEPRVSCPLIIANKEILIAPAVFLDIVYAVETNARSFLIWKCVSLNVTVYLAASFHLCISQRLCPDLPCLCSFWPGQRTLSCTAANRGTSSSLTLTADVIPQSAGGDLSLLKHTNALPVL